jgi:hypothetical protein
MPNPLPWIERKWSFDFPVGVHRDVIERLRGTPARLEEAVGGLDRTTLTRRDGEAWSIQENAGHLWDLEALPAGRLDDFLGGAKTLRAADMTNRMSWEAGHNNAEIDDLLSAFRDARARLVARLDALSDDQFAITAQHPRLDVPMRVVDMCVFQADHDDYHLARITELKRQWGA